MKQKSFIRLDPAKSINFAAESLAAKLLVKLDRFNYWKINVHTNRTAYLTSL
jgi:hypothetical protein